MAGWLEHAQLAQQRGIQWQRGSQRAYGVQVERRRLERELAQLAPIVAGPVHGDLAHAFAPGRIGARRRPGQWFGLPEQRVDGQLVVAGAVALVQQQRLCVGQLERLGGAGQLQVHARGAHPHLAADQVAFAEIDRTGRAEDAAVHVVEDGEVALHHRQLHLAEVPVGLASPVAPVAGGTQVVVAQCGLEDQRLGRQRGAAGLQPERVLGTVAVRGEMDVGHVQLRQAGLFVEPAQVAAHQLDMALGEQPVQERVVAGGGRVRLDRHAGHQQAALGRAAHQHIGALGHQAGELHGQRRHGMPGELAVERAGGEQHALLAVHGAHVACAERRMPTVPECIQLADGQLGGQRRRALLLQPLARSMGLRPQHEADQQHRHHGQRGQRQHDAHQHPPEPGPDRMRHAGTQRAPAATGGRTQPRTHAGRHAGRGCGGGMRSLGSRAGGGGGRLGSGAGGRGTVGGRGRGGGASGHAQIIRQY
ncbi:hypothetical protein D3C86_1193520 [compost metagenome]